MQVYVNKKCSQESIKNTSRGKKCGERRPYVKGRGALARPARVPSTVASTSDLVRVDVQALIDGLEREAALVTEVVNRLGGELLSRALVGLVREDHRVVGCTVTDLIHGLTDGSTVGIAGIDIPGNDGVTARVEVVEFLLVDAAIRRAEETGFTKEESVRTLGWRNTVEKRDTYIPRILNKAVSIRSSSVPSCALEIVVMSVWNQV